MAPTTSQSTVSRSQNNGLLPIPASQTQKQASNTNSTSRKSPGARLKVVIRRLAPSLTESEFTKIIGDEWKLGQGRVDWFSYRPGQNSKDLSKPSRPSRAYLHLTDNSHLIVLADTVRQLKFEDDLNTFNSSCLIGPPVVEFAPYTRMPSGRRRTDARQGTIDQDPEFMEFLEILANPTSVKETVDETSESATGKEGKVTITPLVQYLKEKKANKQKEAAANKAAKHAKGDAQGGKSSGKASKEALNSTEDGKKATKESKKERAVEKASREAVKVLNREAAAKSGGANGSQTPEAPKSSRLQGRERGSIAAAARILQRDLGLSPGNAHRKAKADAAIAAKAAAESQSPSASTPATPTGPKASQPNQGKGRGAKATANKQTGETSKLDKDKPQATPTETPRPPPAKPIVLLKKSSEPAPTSSTTSAPPATPASTLSKQAPAPAQAPTQTPARKAQATPVPSSGATRAFVKHANPSQGITETLLKEAMETFGAVSNVEIDKRKGFAYVDFVEPDGLAKAMAANPTKIAQGTVQVLERKDMKPAREAPGAAGRGGGPSGRGGRGTGASRRGGRGASRGGATESSTTAATNGAAGHVTASAPAGPAAETAK